MSVGIYLQILHVMTRRAKSPVFCLGQIHVDLVNFHFALIGVKAVFWGKFR